MRRRNHLLIIWLLCVVIAVVATLLLSGCGSGSDNTLVLYLSSKTITDQNEIANTLSEWVSARIDEAKVTYSVSSLPDFTLQTIDHWGFQCQESESPTGWCNGLYIPGLHVAGMRVSDDSIKASIYYRITFDHRPTDAELQGKAAHTLISSEEICQLTGVQGWCGLGRWYVGYIPGGQIGYIVLPHEISHLLGMKD